VTAPSPGSRHRAGAPRLQRWGQAGPRALLVHGLVANGEATWSQQRPLAARWDLLVIDRRGYFPNPRIEREDFEIDAIDVADLISELGPLHLVGHSYGGVVCLLAAALAPRAVRSLALIEPPAFGVAADDPDVESFSGELRALFEGGPSVPEVFLSVFLDLCGFPPREQPGPLPEPLLQHARLLQATRHPCEAVVQFEILRRAPFPKIVFSGGHSPAFEKVSDVIADGVGARRLSVTGSGHAVQRTGAPFNTALEGFWQAAERADLQVLSP
jgi:pimeloyl-ACP methyl ester carboxylesterase